MSFGAIEAPFFSSACFRFGLWGCYCTWSIVIHLKPNSWTYNFVEVSGNKLDCSQTWGFCIDFLNLREEVTVFYQAFLLSPLQCTVTEMLISVIYLFSCLHHLHFSVLSCTAKYNKKQIENFWLFDFSPDNEARLWPHSVMMSAEEGGANQT
jgi:hypothetical protein